MTSLLNYLWVNKNENTKEIHTLSLDNDYDEFTVSVAESVSAGAVQNTLCAEPGASRFFKGGVTVYSIDSKKNILGIDIDYAEKENFANVFTTLEMAKSVSKLFNSRIGLATTGYSLPFHRDEDEENGLCELNIENPYAYICLYDQEYVDKHIIKKIEFVYDKSLGDKIQRAHVQAKIAFECQKLFVSYKTAIVDKLSNKASLP